LQPKLKSETTGAKSIKRCTYCKRYDHKNNLSYNKRNCYYYHAQCHTATTKNSVKTRTQLNFPIQKRDNYIKCSCCKTYDLKSNVRERAHHICSNTAKANRTKMSPHKTDTCAFTGLPFGLAEMRPVGDHDHDTLLYRGHIWSSANRLEGAAKFIMNETGWTIDELCDALKSYLAKPGMDIGLEPYPQLGFATLEEAQQHYGNQI